MRVEGRLGDEKFKFVDEPRSDLESEYTLEVALRPDSLRRLMILCSTPYLK